MKVADSRFPLALMGAAAVMALSACSVLEPEKIDYKTAGRGVSLEVPPDLTQLPGQSRYAVTGGTVTASGYQAGQTATQTTGTQAAANAIADVQFRRDTGCVPNRQAVRSAPVCRTRHRDDCRCAGCGVSDDHASGGFRDSYSHFFGLWLAMGNHCGDDSRGHSCHSHVSNLGASRLLFWRCKDWEEGIRLS